MDLLKVAACHAGEGRPYWFLDGLSIIRVSSEDSGGTLCLIEDRLPAGRSSPYHVHRHEDETFHVLEGELTFFSGTQKIHGTPGTTVFLPRNVPHGFRADTAAKVLILATPGGFDRFVGEAGEPAKELRIPDPTPPDYHKLTEIAARYGIEILGPLPE
jgi:quercetin dioxygenase-like cupin family protein